MPVSTAGEVEAGSVHTEEATSVSIQHPEEGMTPVRSAKHCKVEVAAGSRYPAFMLFRTPKSSLDGALL